MGNRLTERNSFLHKIDPRAKIIVFLIFAWRIAFTENFNDLIRFFPFIFILTILSKDQILKTFKFIIFANSFLFFIVITMIFTYKSRNLIHFGFLSISIEGLKYGAFLFVKSNEILILMILLLSTSSVFSLFHALHHLKLPSKLVHLLFFTYRYIHTLNDEYKTIMKSAKCRGFKLNTSLFSYKILGYILGNLIFKSYKKAERIYKAMLARGFKGELSVYYHFKFSFKDWLFLVISGILFLFFCL
ncbi:MAG: cobalt ECF transporter T component CbiQ [Thermodesulfobacteriota bacterium]|nr:MAG: cobalt ECF transporter T component CbiQ [Thermodesulfobacteriota bacterium]